MKKFECNECYKGPCYFEMQQGISGKPKGCLLTSATMPELKGLPSNMKERIIKKEIKPFWGKKMIHHTKGDEGKCPD